MASKSVGIGAARWSVPAGHADARPLQTLDREYLGRFTLGNTELEQEVLQLFAQQASLYLDRLRSAQSGKDWVDAAHTIKGSAAAIGASRLASVARMAERLDIESPVARREGNREGAIEAVAGALEEVCHYISRLAPPA